MQRGRPRKPDKRARGNRAIISLRVSTEEQARPDHYGLPSQEADCRTYCEKMAYELVVVKTDPGISATKPAEKRPGLLAALTMCEKGEADVIVFGKQDRMARKSAVFDAIRDRARKGGYRLEVADTGMDLSAEENDIPAEIGSFVSVIDRLLIAKRLRGGRRERSKRDGRGSGPLPWGYIEDEAFSVGIDKGAQKTIQTLLRLREHRTYQATANELNKRGYRTATGKKWTTGSVQTVERNRELYTTGVRRWNGITAEKRWPVLVKEEYK